MTVATPASTLSVSRLIPAAAPAVAPVPAVPAVIPLAVAANFAPVGSSPTALCAVLLLEAVSTLAAETSHANMYWIRGAQTVFHAAYSSPPHLRLLSVRQYDRMRCGRVHRLRVFANTQQ